MCTRNDICYIYTINNAVQQVVNYVIVDALRTGTEHKSQEGRGKKKDPETEKKKNGYCGRQATNTRANAATFSEPCGG